MSEGEVNIFRSLTVNALGVRVRILNGILYATGSQWRDMSIGVMRDRLFDLVSSYVAAFRIACKRDTKAKQKERKETKQITSG